MQAQRHQGGRNTETAGMQAHGDVQDAGTQTSRMWAHRDSRDAGTIHHGCRHTDIRDVGTWIHPGYRHIEKKPCEDIAR